MELKRYFIEFSYDGLAFHGWQRQPNALSVQEVIEDGLSKLLKKKIPIIGAGRTDAGVHARQMFAHFNASINEGCLKDLVFLRSKEKGGVKRLDMYKQNLFLKKDLEPNKFLKKSYVN